MRDDRTRISSNLMTRHELGELEAKNLLVALKETNWKIYGPRGAAEILGMRPTTLASRLKSWASRSLAEGPCTSPSATACFRVPLCSGPAIRVTSPFVHLVLRDGGRTSAPLATEALS